MQKKEHRDPELGAGCGVKKTLRSKTTPPMGGGELGSRTKEERGFRNKRGRIRSPQRGNKNDDSGISGKRESG